MTVFCVALLIFAIAGIFALVIDDLDRVLHERIDEDGYELEPMLALPLRRRPAELEEAEAS